MAELGDGIGLAEVGLSFPASVSVISGRDPRRDGAAYVDQIVLGWTGGAGGPVADGWLTMGGVGDAGILMRDSIELDELRFPIQIDAQYLLQDSEGAGRRRGAPAAILEFHPVDAELEAIYLSDGTINPPQGARGGEAGSTASQHLRDTDGTVTKLDLCARVQVRPGQVVVSKCNGGGGYGDPLQREPERVLRDVHERWVSRERARSAYGVVITADLTVDTDETIALRRARAAEPRVMPR